MPLNDEERAGLIKDCDGIIEDSRTFHINANVMRTARALKAILSSLTRPMVEDRDAMIEECAEIAECMHGNYGLNIAIHIRALKTAPSPTLSAREALSPERGGDGSGPEGTKP